MTKRYTATLHAIERAHLRFGVALENAETWFREELRRAKYISSQGSNKIIYENEGKTFVVNVDERKIITVRPTADAAFLQPIFERERRKAKRLLTKTTRALELEMAHLLIEKGEQTLNKARARNPKTRALIQERINEIEAKINECKTDIARAKDEYENHCRVLSLVGG
ncbi:hypothetical protein [Bacillus chungangensis]|uniref:Uncharacterized protein n=1 Tax=Bacillus chungangensis TaxID=587633 RepID=A0ABT9WMV6_9BACI|nr:hypothetical protein [Bacillus chungangensis]MDQ0174439.1 hypothetical protein [Bacillus chungangensis]